MKLYLRIASLSAICTIFVSCARNGSQNSNDITINSDCAKIVRKFIERCESQEHIGKPFSLEIVEIERSKILIL